MKKILIFSTAYFPFVGGAEVAVKEITDRLSKGEFSARGGPAFGWDMITARMDKKLLKFEKVGNVNVYRIGCGCKITDKFLLPFFGLKKALKLHKKNNYDITWPIMASQASIVAVFLKIFKPKIKLILTLQEGDEEEHLKRYVLGSDLLYKFFVQPWHLLVFKKADYVTAISNYLKERALKNKVKCLVKVIPNGVDLEKFTLKSGKDIEINDARKVSDNKYSVTITEEKLQFIKEIDSKDNLIKDDKLIITVSRLVKKNGIEYLIKAMKYLPENYKLRIVGGGELRNELEQLAKDLGLTKRVTFHGEVNNKNIQWYYYPQIESHNIVFVRPSLSEGLGNVFLEAMHVNIPVIGTLVGGIPDFLEDGKTGWFCKVKDPASIAEKISYILDDKNKEEVKKVSENAKEMVMEKYNWDNIAQKFKQIFNNLEIYQ